MSHCYPAIGSAAMLRSVADYLGAPKPYKFLPGIEQPTGQTDYLLQLIDWLLYLDEFEKVSGVSFLSWVGRNADELMSQLPPDLMIKPRFEADLTAVLRQVITTEWEIPGTARDRNSNPLHIGSWLAFKMKNLGESLQAVWAKDYAFETPVFRLKAANGAGSILVAQLNNSVAGPELLKAALAMIKASEEQPVETLKMPKVKTPVVSGEMLWMEGIKVGGATLKNAHFAANLIMDENGSKSAIDMDSAWTVGYTPGKVHWEITGPMVRVHEFAGLPMDIHWLGTDAYYS